MKKIHCISLICFLLSLCVLFSSCEKGVDLNRASGIYDSNGKLISTWDELERKNRLNISNGMLIEMFHGEGDEIAEIIVPNHIDSLYNYSFKNFRSLKRVILPEGVADVGKYAFAGCDAFEDLYVLNSKCIVYREAFIGIKNPVTIHYSGTKEDWLSPNDILFSKEPDAENNIPKITVECTDGKFVYDN